MKLNEFLTRYGETTALELAQCETTAELQQQLTRRGITDTGINSEELMAVLYPLRGKKQPISDDDLDSIAGGTKSKPTVIPITLPPPLIM